MEKKLRVYEAYTGECLVNYTSLRKQKVRSSVIRMLYTVWDNLKISLSIFIILRNMRDIGGKVLGATFMFQAFCCLAALSVPLDLLCSWNCHWRICDSHPFLFIMLLCILAHFLILLSAFFSLVQIKLLFCGCHQNCTLQKPLIYAWPFTTHIRSHALPCLVFPL